MSEQTALASFFECPFGAFSLVLYRLFTFFVVSSLSPCRFTTPPVYCCFFVVEKVRSRFRHELALWPNPEVDAAAASASSSGAAAVAAAAWAEGVASKPALLRRTCQKLGLRVRAAPYDFGTPQPFEVGQLLPARITREGWEAGARQSCARVVEKGPFSVRAPVLGFLPSCSFRALPFLLSCVFSREERPHTPVTKNV